MTGGGEKVQTDRLGNRSVPFFLTKSLIFAQKLSRVQAARARQINFIGEL